MPQAQKNRFKILLTQLTFILTILSFSQLKAQEGFEIVARVMDEKGEPLFGNLLVLSPADSALIKGNYFMDGIAGISGIKEVSVLVKITSMGYRDTLLGVNNLSFKNRVDLGEIRLQQSSLKLEEVAVVGNVPLFESSLDGTIKVNVQKTMLAVSTSLNEVLAKSPNVLVGENGLAVVGKGEAVLYLDGKQIPFERLGSIPVNSIAQVEVVTNPSGKFDAEGRAAVNLITVPDYSEGIQGTMVQHLTLARYFMSSTRADLNYRKGKWSLSGGYGVDLGKDWSLYKSARTQESGEAIRISDVEANQNFQQTYLSNYRAGLGYQINPQSDVSLEYAGSYNILGLWVESNNVLTTNGQETNLLQALTDGDHFFHTNSLTLNYNYALDTLGSTLFAGGQYFNFDGGLTDIIDEEIYASDVLQSKAMRKNIGRHISGLATSQLDYARVLKDGAKVEVGAKFASVRYRGSVGFFSAGGEGEEFVKVPAYTSDYRYQEDIPSVYLQYNGNLLGNLTYTAGIRSEYTFAKGTSVLTNSVLTDSSYLNFFPGFSVSGKASENIQLGASYSARINRPRYEDLDPFLVYLDSLTSYRGNPYLVPEITHAFEQTTTYKNANLKLGYNYSLNPFRHVVVQGNKGDGNLELTQMNFQKLHAFFASLSVPFEVKFWSSNNTLSASLDKFVDERPQLSFNEVRPGFYFYSYNKLNVMNQFDVEVSGEYVGAQNNGIYHIAPTGFLSAGLSKTFLNNALTCRLLANDIFHTNTRVISYQIGTIQTRTEIIPNTRFYRLSLTYSFGKLKKVTYRNRAIGGEETNRL